MRKAACVGYPPEWWDFHRGRRSAPGARRAFAICGSCPVRRQCLEAAYEPIPKSVVAPGNAGRALGVGRVDLELTDDASEYLIWGGTTPNQRRAVRHLPLELRISALLAQVEAERTRTPSPRRLEATRPKRRASKRRSAGGRRLYGLEARALGIVAAAPGRFTKAELSRRLGVRRQVAVAVVEGLVQSGRLGPDAPRVGLRPKPQVGAVPA